MSMDPKDYAAQAAYETFLSKLPRAERRRILKAHWKRIEHAKRKEVKNAHP